MMFEYIAYAPKDKEGFTTLEVFWFPLDFNLVKFDRTVCAWQTFILVLSDAKLEM
jgi:hypothetical protein